MTAAITERRLWFGLLAAPVAWGIEGLAGWAIGGHVCSGLAIGTARGLVGVISLVMLAVGAAGLLAAWRSWQEVASLPHPRGDRVQFMAMGGVLVSVPFLIGIFWFGLNGWLVTGCGSMR